MPIKIPSVKAPDLTRRSHNIDIPAGAFGEPVGAAIGKIGADTADAANKVNIALARFDERRSVVEANKAFKELPISEGNALIAAKKDPNRNLPTFQPDYTAAQDKRNKAIIDALSPRALPHFMLQYNTLQKNQALDAMNWALGQEVVEGRNEMNEAVAKLASTASTVADTLALKGQIRDKIFEAHINNVLLDGKMRAKDPDVEAKKWFRQVDLNKAYSRMTESPEAVGREIKAGKYPDLTDKDKKTLLDDIPGARRRIEERAKLSMADAYLHKRISLREKRNKNIDTFQDYEVEIRKLDAAVEAGDVDALAEQEFLIEEQKDSLMSQEERELEAAKTIVESRDATALADRLQGKPPKIVWTDDEKAAAFNDFTEEFRDFGIIPTGIGKGKKSGELGDEFKLKDKNNPLARMSKILDFWSRVSLAQRAGLLSEKEGNMFFQELIPVLRAKIESKHFQEAGDMPFWGATKEFFGGQREIERTADKFSEVYTAVLKTLGDNATNVEKRTAITAAYDLIRSTSFDKNEPVVERKAKVDQIAAEAVKEMNYTKWDVLRGLNLPHRILEFIETPDRTPVPVFKVPTQAVIDVMKANPNNANTKKIFIERYGQDQFDAITGALRRGMFKVEPTPAELHELGQAQAGQDADAKREFIDTHGQGWYNFHTGKPDDHKGI